MKTLPLVLVLVAGAARADVWQRTFDDPARAQGTQDVYEGALRKGDEQVGEAMTRTASYKIVKEAVGRAETEYRRAAAARPDQAEPYFRIGTLIRYFYLDCQDADHPITCDAYQANLPMAKKAVDAWDAFEARAPLDPRVNEILFNRGIERTKLVAGASHDEAQRLLAAAAHDYEELLARTDGGMRRDDVLLGNLAETYMMLGRLDDAIAMYERAVRAGGSGSTVYGLAVALDRDDSGETALAMIRDQGPEQLQAFREAFQSRNVFFVPAGEEYYYFALVDEAFGEVEESIQYWQSYLQSGAHPEYQPRAKQHIEQLQKRRKPRLRPQIESPWPQDLLP